MTIESRKRRRVASLLAGVALLPVAGLVMSQALGSPHEGDGYPVSAARTSIQGAAVQAAAIEETDEDFVEEQAPGYSKGPDETSQLQDVGGTARLEALRRLAAQAAQPVTQGRITMSGEGVFRARPDAAILRFGVRSYAEAAGAAMDANAKAARKLHESLAAAGVKPEEIATDQISVEPDPEKTSDRPGERTVGVKRGYLAQNSVSVDIRNLPARPASFLGDLVMAAREAGATDVSGPEFKLVDDARALASARKDAVDDATVKAATFAHALGAKIGRIVEIREGNTRPEPVVALAMRAAASPPIATGTRDVTASVVVVWEVDQP